MLTSLVAAFVLISPGLSQQPKPSDWERILRKFAGSSELSLVVDVNTSVEAPPIDEFEDQHFALELLTQVAARHLQIIDGTYVLTRSSDAGKSVPAINQRQLEWIKSLSAADIARLASGTFDLASLKNKDRAQMLGLLPLTPAQMRAVVADPSQAQVSLGVWVKGSYADPKTGKGLSAFGWTALPSGGLPADKPTSEPVSRPAFYRPSTTGAISFVDGELVTVNEFFSRATKATQRVYVYDRRLKDSWLFVRGQFDTDSFERIAKAVLKPISFERLSDSDAAIAQLDEVIKSEVMKNLLNSQRLAPSAKDLVRLAFTRPEVPSESLDQIPGFADAFSRQGIGAGTKVRLRPLLALAIHFGPPNQREGSVFLIGD